jgi:hypothetical protein
MSESVVPTPPLAVPCPRLANLPRFQDLLLLNMELSEKVDTKNVLIE